MNTARILARIALDLYRKGSKQEAEQIWQDAKEIYERVLIKQQATKPTA